MFGDFPEILLLLISLVIYCDQNTYFVSNPFKFIETCLTAQNMVYLDKLMGIFEKNVYFANVEWKCYTNVKSSVFLLYCLPVLSIIKREVLKSSTATGGFSISPYSSFSFCFMYFEALLLDSQTFRIVMAP